MKHSKYRNTGLLFELITRQITADILNKESNSPAIDILKKNFNKKSQLFRENKLFNVIIEAKHTGNKERAVHLIETTVKAYNKIINRKALQKEKYELIKQIKENFNIGDFFKSHVSNYRLLAAINNVLHEDYSNPAVSTQNHFTIVEHITRKVEKPEEQLMDKLRSENKDLRSLAYKILVEKFNNKYKSLLPEQKNVLKEYINNISNTNGLNEFMESKFKSISYNLKKVFPKIDNKVVKIKIKECINLIETVNTKKGTTTNNVLKLMRFYQLLEDVKYAVKS